MKREMKTLNGAISSIAGLCRSLRPHRAGHPPESAATEIQIVLNSLVTAIPLTPRPTINKDELCKC